MKTKHIILTALVILTGVGTGAARAATNDVSALLQKGLFEEEANHNLDAAIAAYQAVVTQTEKDRQFAATAIFRLGECYRKLGRTNDANVQYQRIVSDFADQAELAKLSRSYLGETAGNPPTQVIAQRADLVDLKIDPEQDELKRIQALIKDSPDLINGGGLNEAPLLGAVRRDYLTVAKFLLDNKADVNIQSGLPLSVAVEQGRKEMVELLVDRGADVNLGSVDAEGHGPLLEASQKGYKAIAEVLLAHKADVNIRDRNGATPLHLAARDGFLSVVELLLANGADVNAGAEDGQTPLHYAASANRTSVMELLLAHKADVNARARDGTTPLMTAVLYSQASAAKLLLEHGANVNAARADTDNFRSWMPLHFAIYHDETELVKLLLDNKADANARVPSYPGASPINRAGRGFGGGGGGGGGFGSGGPRTTPPFNPNVGWYADFTPLAATVIGGQPKIAQLLLDHQADVNAPDKDADTPLSLAVKFKRPDMVDLLLAHGAAVQSLNKDHLSPLSLAVNDNLQDIVKLLLAHKPDLEVVDNSDATPLQAAVMRREVNVAEMLLGAGAKTEVRYTHNYGWLSNPTGTGLLQVAVGNQDEEMVALLLAHHANPNFQDFSGSTPLSWAKSQVSNKNNNSDINRKYREIAELLEKAGANDNLQRLTRISVGRNGSEQLVFSKGTNDFNHYTLFELLANHYENPRSGSLPFPDFSKIKISRLGANGRTNIINVDLEAAFNSSDCSKDVPLQWGDIVEIPETDHNVNANWGWLADPVRRTLGSCLSSHVAIVVKGRTNNVTLTPNLAGGPGQINMVMNLQAIGQTPAPNSELASFGLYGVVHGANVLLTSSDLSRVKVRRTDPATKKKVEMVFNLEKNDPQNQLWLRDGDVIEVPEKP